MQIILPIEGSPIYSSVSLIDVVCPHVFDLARFVGVPP